MQVNSGVRVKDPKLHRLKELRKMAGIGQREMADLMLMAKSTYAQKEIGKSAITLREAKRAAKIFDVGVEELFFDEKFVCEVDD